MALSKTDFCILYFWVGIFVFGTNFDFFWRNFIISEYFFHFFGFLGCDQILYFWGNDEILYFWHSDEILHFWGNDEILHFWEFRKFCYFDTKNLNFVSKKLKIRIQKIKIRIQKIKIRIKKIKFRIQKIKIRINKNSFSSAHAINPASSSTHDPTLSPT